MGANVDFFQVADAPTYGYVYTFKFQRFGHVKGGDEFFHKRQSFEGRFGPNLCEYFVTIHAQHKIRGIRDASSSGCCRSSLIFVD